MYTKMVYAIYVSTGNYVGYDRIGVNYGEYR